VIVLSGIGAYVFLSGGDSDQVDETTTTTTSSSTTSTTSTTSSTTSTTSTTTLAPFYICEDKKTVTGMVETSCLSKITRENSNTTIRARVTYKLANVRGGYDEFHSVVVGEKCLYRQESITDTSFSSQLTCVIPMDLELEEEAQLIIP